MPGAHCAIVNCGRHYSKSKFPSVRFCKIPTGEKDEAWAKTLIAIVNRQDKGFTPEKALYALLILNQSANIKVSSFFLTFC